MILRINALFQVKPVYLVIDTNAFIDQLTAIQKILQAECFRVLIPTTGALGLFFFICRYKLKVQGNAKIVEVNPWQIG